MKKAALKKYGLNFCSKKAPEKTDASCCNIQFLFVFPVTLFLACRNVYDPVLSVYYPKRIAWNLSIAAMVISFIPFFIGVSFKFINGGEHCAASVASVHPHAFFVSVFFPMANFFLCRNIYNPNFFLRLRRRGRSCRRLGRRSSGRFGCCSRLRCRS